MPRRVSLPGAAELFRATPADTGPTRPPAPRVGPDVPGPDPIGPVAEPTEGPVDDTRAPEPVAGPQDPAPEEPSRDGSGRDRTGRDRSGRRTGRGTGRMRHDEKITVYVSSDELLDLERARLSLRAEHGMAVDRGRIVREALALVIADLAERGADSDLVRRLSQP